MISDEYTPRTMNNTPQKTKSKDDIEEMNDFPFKLNLVKLQKINASWEKFIVWVAL